MSNQEHWHLRGLGIACQKADRHNAIASLDNEFSAIDVDKRCAKCNELFLEAKKTPETANT